jgi:lipoprotein signal peptidase
MNGGILLAFFKDNQAYFILIGAIIVLVFIVFMVQRKFRSLKPAKRIIELVSEGESAVYADDILLAREIYEKVLKLYNSSNINDPLVHKRVVDFYSSLVYKQQQFSLILSP